MLGDGGVVWIVGDETWGRYYGELVLDECRVESIDGGDRRKSPLFMMTPSIATLPSRKWGGEVDVRPVDGSGRMRE